MSTLYRPLGYPCKNCEQRAMHFIMMYFVSLDTFSKIQIILLVIKPRFENAYNRYKLHNTFAKPNINLIL